MTAVGQEPEPFPLEGVRDIGGAFEDEGPPLRDPGPDPGLELYDWLFPAVIERELYEDIGRVGEGLCIVLSFDPDDAVQRRLFGLPWERLRDGKDPWVLTRRPVIRRWSVEVGEPEPVDDECLRILAIPVADEALDLDAERRSLETIRDRGGPFVLEVLDESPSIVDLRSRLEDGSFHVLHIMGHGQWDDWLDAWTLDLGGEPVDAETLGLLLGDESLRLRLVVLNTCHGARVDAPVDGDGSSVGGTGLAEELVRRGAMAVVANRRAIGDRAAHVLARGLYRRLARQIPLEQALGGARLDLRGEESGSEVRTGEWAIPALIVRAPARAARGHLVDLPDPIDLRPSRGAVALAGLMLAALGHLATLAARLIYPPELFALVVLLVGGSCLLVRSWWRSRPRPHPLSTCVGRLDRRLRTSRRSTLMMALVVMVAAVTAWASWLQWGRPRVAALPCLRSGVGELGPADRLVLVHFEEASSNVRWPELWQRDLSNILRRAGLEPVAADSRVGRRRVPPHCYAWQLNARSAVGADGIPSSTLEVYRRGELSGSWQEPQAPADIRDRALSWVLSIFELQDREIDPRSLARASREANTEALRLYRDGDLGGAVDILDAAVSRDEDAALLRNNLAQMLLDSARELRRSALAAPTGRRAVLEEDARELTQRAVRHLDRASDLDPDAPLYPFQKGRALVDLGLTRQAAEAFERALTLAPDFPEAANDLAVLWIEDGGPDQLGRAIRLLNRAESRISQNDRRTLAAILGHLGRAHALIGELDTAWRVLDRAECVVLPEDFSRRAELLAETARLHETLLGPASATVSWRRYGELLTYDPDPARRRDFFRWQRDHPDRSLDRVTLDAWADRCRAAFYGRS